MSPLPRLSPLGRIAFALAVFSLSFWALAGVAFLAWSSPGRTLAATTLARLVDSEANAAETIATAEADDDSGSVCDDACDDAAKSSSSSSSSSSHSYSYSYTDDDGDDDGHGFAWALVDRDGSCYIENGNATHVRARAVNGRPTFWFRDEDGQEFWVDDPAVVAEVRKVTEPMRQIGKEMGKVGAEMGRHGASMGRLGGQMGALGARMGAVEAQLAARSAAGYPTDAARKRELEDMRDQLRQLQDQLNDAQSDHASSQRALSRRMSELSAKNQKATREARDKVQDIAHRARREGKAERPHANA